VTIARRGFIDHSDSLGATARFGRGDVQWLTAGAGIVHSEMFPLLDPQEKNPVELFQIWLNLPGESKFVKPYFTMFWSGDIPRVPFEDAGGRKSEITVVAGGLNGVKVPAPPPQSWASRPESDVAIWCIRLEPGARLTLPQAAGEETLRTLYFFRGRSLEVGGRSLDSNVAIATASEAPLALQAGDEECELLLLQGRPIGEPVVQYGPFVMNTREQIENAISDYRRTRFGGWPFPGDDPVHPRDRGRFARHADGRIEEGR
jgi:redox-sensitive bicupin YhaK (pirin superfamily)